MRPKKPLKTLVALVCTPELKDSVLAVLPAQFKNIYTPSDLIAPIVNKVLRHAFDVPAIIGEHHVRHFFANVNRGVFAVQHFVGKSLTSKAEALDFFVNTVGVKAYGKDWLLDEVAKSFKSAKEGNFLVLDLTLEQAAKLKTALNSSFSVLYVGEDSSVKADFKVTPPVSKAAIKRITNQIFKNNPNQGEENERIAS